MQIFHSDIIKLPNRDGFRTELVRVGDTNDYYLYTEFPYMQISYDEEGKLFSVDPSGGPFMTVGYEISDELCVTGLREEDRRYILTIGEKDE